MGYRIVILKALYLGASFFFLFFPFITIQSFITSLYGIFGYYSYMAIYLPYALSSLFAPWIGKHIGVRISLIIGASGYVLWLVAMNFSHQILIIIASILNGFSSGLLWVNQGIYINRLYRLLPNPAKQSSIISGIFFALYNFNLVIGNFCVIGLIWLNVDYTVIGWSFTAVALIAWVLFLLLPSPNTAQFWEERWLTVSERAACNSGTEEESENSDSDSGDEEKAMIATASPSAQRLEAPRLERQISARFGWTPAQWSSRSPSPPLEINPPVSSNQKGKGPIITTIGTEEKMAAGPDTGGEVSTSGVAISGGEEPIAQSAREAAPPADKTLDSPPRTKSVRWRDSLLVQVVEIETRQQLAKYDHHFLTYWEHLWQVSRRPGLWLLLPQCILLSFLTIYSYGVLPALYSKGQLLHSAYFLLCYGVTASLGSFLWSYCQIHYSFYRVIIGAHALLTIQGLWILLTHSGLLAAVPNTLTNQTWLLASGLIAGLIDTAMISRINVIISRFFPKNEVSVLYALYRWTYCLGVSLAAYLNTIMTVGPMTIIILLWGLLSGGSTLWYYRQHYSDSLLVAWRNSLNPAVRG